MLYLSGKGLPGTNALAYSASMLVTKKKSFITLILGVKIGGLAAIGGSVFGKNIFFLQKLNKNLLSHNWVL
jgi:hypothetical protein